ncbi:hypothetical protein PV367_38365 [Streptomyces europaeiscabiei]|uniref:Uncharacterized protein n=1 Tax=Streptomyces europaeiscabiei TaxID=146819 RepID=A0AAJ2PYC1_9ACTN|nr:MULTISPECIES: hypothetical protein [Streptomyces]KFF97692.1 hypothetical protein IQ62_29440 [Streptomyces scabiei]MDX2523272.1 hypothetical protein [Streptomyces europaeiscabiei]MDX2764671.1 hypothetical protein [Streptomyces europaeiscabiei]MDX2774189.1 hypothetical protein [Streptomyces europaeiscabiei]MDX3135531.1 hypothetical protein [Streptomyces europaeiscabiei]
MNDRVAPAMHATPDGEAEISLVVRLPWEDVAALGQEAGRLAARMQRPVTLDEAVSHRLRSARPAAAHAKPAAAPTTAPAAVTSSASVSSLPARPPAEQARQAIDRITGTSAV